MEMVDMRTSKVLAFYKFAGSILATGNFLDVRLNNPLCTFSARLLCQPKVQVLR
jgi:hypothetical protein